MINTLKEIVAEKKKHSEILKKKINVSLKKYFFFIFRFNLTIFLFSGHAIQKEGNGQR